MNSSGIFAFRPEATKRRWFVTSSRVIEIAMALGRETLAYCVARVYRGRRGGCPSSAARARIALERLGPTFIKLGQVLASQVDLLPDALRRELSALLDHAVTVPYGAIAQEISDAYGRQVEHIFANFGVEPIASASISQVHEATLAGRRVAVKVRRPGVVSQVETDLAILGLAAKVLQRVSKLAQRHDAVGMAGQVADMVRAELDFEAEAANADQIRLALAGDARVIVPAVYKHLTRPNVLVMEYVDGVPLSDPARLEASGQDRRKIATTVMSAALSMMEKGRFHCDLHPGNILGLEDGRIAILDYGACGTAGAPAREALATLLTAMATADPRLLSKGALGFMMVTRPYDEDLLAQRLSEILSPLASEPLQSISVGRALLDLVQVMQACGLRLRSDIALLLKAVITAEATARDLHAEASFAQVLVSFMAQHGDGLRPGSPPPEPGAPQAREAAGPTSLRPRRRVRGPACHLDIDLLDLRIPIHAMGTTDEGPLRLPAVGA